MPGRWRPFTFVVSLFAVGSCASPVAPAPAIAPPLVAAKNPTITLQLKSVTPSRDVVLAPGDNAMTATFEYDLLDATAATLNVVEICGWYPDWTCLDAGRVGSITTSRGTIDVTLHRKLAADSSWYLDFSLSVPGLQASGGGPSVKIVYRVGS